MIARLACLLAVLLVCVMIAVPVLATLEVTIYCEGDLCFATRDDMRAIAERMRQLENLAGKNCI